jgi:hypothetical protein
MMRTPVAGASSHQVILVTGEGVLEPRELVGKKPRLAVKLGLHIRYPRPRPHQHQVESTVVRRVRAA